MPRQDGGKGEAGQANLDAFLNQAPQFMTDLVAGVTAMQQTTQQMRNDLNGNAVQVNAALVKSTPTR